MASIVCQPTFCFTASMLRERILPLLIVSPRRTTHADPSETYLGIGKGMTMLMLGAGGA